MNLINTPSVRLERNILLQILIILILIIFITEH